MNRPFPLWVPEENREDVEREQRIKRLSEIRLLWMTLGVGTGSTRRPDPKPLWLS